ncbi:ATP-binding protein [Parasediminibacterium sp. JCM 36343]|uniref:ATP-binding protein n=1 Tax=Parasediminibacterium sp. JCM 36343 TaxID=3374279 RepID=UPI003978E9B5
MDNERECGLGGYTNTQTDRNEMYQRIFDLLIEGVQIHDFNWKYLYVNDTLVKNGKWTSKELLGHTLQEKYPAIAQTMLFKAMQACMTERVPQQLECESPYTQSPEKWYSFSIKPIPEGIVVLSVDISAQKLTGGEKLAALQLAYNELSFLYEEKKKKTAALIIDNKEFVSQYEKTLKEVSYYKYALDESSILAITDQKGIITHANQNFCNISKYTVAELIGKDHRIINSGYHSKQFISNLWATISQGQIWRGELKNKAKDGTIYWVDTTIVPFLNEDGKPYQYVAIRADITARKQAEEEISILNESLEKRVKERTEDLESFSYSVSHDLRSPLRAVNGYARMIEEDYAPLFEAEGRRLLKEVQHNAKKMGILIDDLLSFSRLGRKEVKKAMINMDDLTKAALAEIDQTITHHASIQFKDLLPVKADYTLLEHVMINLLSNAIKYSSKKEQPIIEITSKKDNGQIVYAVKDNGVGFDMKYANKLFGVFQRLHSTEEFAGTGVGLAIVQRVIQKHEGKIWATGKVGEGATFFFSLPDSEGI